MFGTIPINLASKFGRITCHSPHPQGNIMHQSLVHSYYNYFIHFHLYHDHNFTDCFILTEVAGSTGITRTPDGTTGTNGGSGITRTTVGTSGATGGTSGTTVDTSGGTSGATGGTSGTTGGSQLGTSYT